MKRKYSRQQDPPCQVPFALNQHRQRTHIIIIRMSNTVHGEDDHQDGHHHEQQHQQQQQQQPHAHAHSSLLTCEFNQDGGCLAIGTTSGFSVHNLHPQYAVSVQRELQGGIGLVEMLFRCNLMALVGGGPSPQAPPHRVVRKEKRKRKDDDERNTHILFRVCRWGGREG